MSDIVCPVPTQDYARIVLAHGAGGRLMQRLIADVFVEAFDDPQLVRGHDGALVDVPPPIAVTTDAFTVAPIFFPGGDIGSLAVFGTVNDLAMCGARPVCLTAAFVLEEGLPMADLRRVVQSMAEAARSCGVRIVTGDTKVVERGKGDAIFITTTGVGTVLAPQTIGPSAIAPGDAILLSGPVGDHGIAVMLARDDLGLASNVKSDASSVLAPCVALLEAGLDVHALRDPTRGGLASALNELAGGAKLGFAIQEKAILVRPEVADACELLGFDPFYVACEGRFVAIVPQSQSDQALRILHAHGCPQAASIGRVVSEHRGTVVVETPSGGQRMLDMLAGDQLPRIC